MIEAERMGVDIIWSAEAWGMDGVTTLAYLAAVTSKVTLGTGILQISARSRAGQLWCKLPSRASCGRNPVGARPSNS